MNSTLVKIAGGIAASVVVATGGAAWNANAENREQNARIESLQQMHAEQQKAQQHVIAQLVETNKNLAVLTERLEHVQRRLDEQR